MTEPMHPIDQEQMDIQQSTEVEEKPTEIDPVKAYLNQDKDPNDLDELIQKYNLKVCEKIPNNLTEMLELFNTTVVFTHDSTLKSFVWPKKVIEKLVPWLPPSPNILNPDYINSLVCPRRNAFSWEFPQFHIYLPLCVIPIPVSISFLLLWLVSPENHVELVDAALPQFISSNQMLQIYIYVISKLLQMKLLDNEVVSDATIIETRKTIKILSQMYDARHDMFVEFSKHMEETRQNLNKKQKANPENKLDLNKELDDCVETMINKEEFGKFLNNLHEQVMIVLAQHTYTIILLFERVIMTHMKIPQELWPVLHTIPYVPNLHELSARTDNELHNDINKFNQVILALTSSQQNAEDFKLIRIVFGTMAPFHLLTMDKKFHGFLKLMKTYNRENEPST